MAQAKELLSTLEAFLGEDRFHRFISQGFTPRRRYWLKHEPRLRYWQEQQWQRFAEAHPEFAVSMAELEIILRICELHRLELQQDFEEVFHGNMDYTPEYTEACLRLFPHSETGPIPTEGLPFEGERVEVFYCPECRRAEAHWRARSRR